MTTAMYERQFAILSPELAEVQHATICGCGTVGSNVAVQLAKLGIRKFDLWDMDKVELHNVPSQDFSIADVGKDKVDALGWRLASLLEEHEINTCPDPLEGNEIFDAGIVVLAVDSMDMRRKIYETSVKGLAHVDLMLDFRMGGSNLQAWCIDPTDPDDQRRYEATLYSSGDVSEMPCGTRTFAPVGALSGAVAAQMVTNHLTGRRRPFYTVVDLGTFTMSAVGGFTPEEEASDDYEAQ